MAARLSGVNPPYALPTNDTTAPPPPLQLHGPGNEIEIDWWDLNKWFAMATCITFFGFVLDAIGTFNIVFNIVSVASMPSETQMKDVCV